MTILTEEREELYLQEAIYAEKFTAELPPLEQKLLAELILEYKNSSKFQIESYMFLANKVMNNPKLVEAFTFTTEVYPHSMIHKQVFLLLDGEVLKCYFHRFIRLWSKGVDTDFIWKAIPRNLLDCMRDYSRFGSHYYRTILELPKVSVGDKNIMIQNWLVNCNLRGEVLTEEDITFLLALENKEKVDIFSAIHDIKRVLNLQDVPDEWIEESYNSGKHKHIEDGTWQV